MKFFFFRSNLEAVVHELENGLQKLNFDDNFQGFSWTGGIAASSEEAIPNEFRDGTIPSGFIIVDAVGVNTVVRGDTEWTEDVLSLKNFNTTTTAEVTVFFFR